MLRWAMNKQTKTPVVKSTMNQIGQLEEQVDDLQSQLVDADIDIMFLHHALRGMTGIETREEAEAVMSALDGLPGGGSPPYRLLNAIGALLSTWPAGNDIES